MAMDLTEDNEPAFAVTVYSIMDRYRTGKVEHRTACRALAAITLALAPDHLLNEIEHFFSIYKDLEPGKSTDTRGFEGREAALKELAESQEAFRQAAGES